MVVVYGYRQSAIVSHGFETSGAAEVGVSRNLLRSHQEPDSLFFKKPHSSRILQCVNWVDWVIWSWPVFSTR
jgi:hypothetical protein